MENLLGPLAFALFTAAQLFAVIAEHTARTSGPSGKPSFTDRQSERPFRGRRAFQAAR